MYTYYKLYDNYAAMQVQLEITVLNIMLKYYTMLQDTGSVQKHNN